ncbi:MAG: proline--tRNA ligase [Candidatus Omnitrophica bacterium]|nr:proline--tRNA ligase [Candidatus Omnitrophota bacterium]
MKWSELLLPTLKEVPSEAEAVSHILMIRAGLIRKLTSGVYSYLPVGLRVLSKVENIIRQEMNKKGAQQLLLPAIQPAELWQKSGRFDALGQDMITFIDRHKKLNVLGPTHEEVITSLVKNEINSYRQMPIILYQIQTKFRDEARPRFGIIRSREFIMKDAYSFDRDIEGLGKSYDKMYDAYCRIFERCGMKFLPVEADTGIMGGDASHEFMVLAESGEDKIVQCEKCAYAASLDKAECLPPQATSHKPQATSQEVPEEVSTPGVSSVDQVAEFLKIPVEQLVKTIIYLADGKPVAVLVRGDHEINETKLSKVLKAVNLEMANSAIIEKVTKGPIGFSGPIELSDIEIYADYAVEEASNVVVGSNKADTHTRYVDIARDVKIKKFADIRSITAKDKCPRCGADIKINQAIEVGHVFKLGTKYTESLGATFLDEQGKAHPIIMGCYGIGVTRIIAAFIEQNFDENGIVWSKELTPFQVILMPLNTADELSMKIAESIYNKLIEQNIEVIFDDRDIRAGIKFKDADLIGIPLQVIIGPKNIANNIIELKVRRSGQREEVSIDQASNRIMQIVQE